jgi:hypothetical protein
MASTTFSFADDDSGSDHEHWPDDFKSAPTVAAPAFDPHHGVRMQCHCHAAPSTKAASPPPPPPAPVEAAVLTELPVQYTYAPPVNMSTHAYIPAAAAATFTVPAPAPPDPQAPKPAAQVPNTYTYHPSYAEKPAEAPTNKWQGRTRVEVEEDNLKIAADEKVWEKRKVVPTGLAEDQMCWVVEVDSSYTLR